MKKPTPESAALTSKFLARFGGRFLCRSPPQADGGSRRWRPEISRHTRSIKSLLRQALRHVLALAFCLIVAAIILTDPLCSAILAAGLRLRRTQPERIATTTAIGSLATVSTRVP
jgi:hypothetical protein